VGFYNNENGGLSVDGTAASGGAINISVKDSVANNNGQPQVGSGFTSTSGVGKAATRLILTRTVVSNNTTFGILSQGSGAQVIVDSSTIFNNGHAWVARESGFIFSHGNNSAEDNAADFGPVTPAAALE